MKEKRRELFLRIRKRLKKYTRTIILFAIALSFAIIFLLPTVLTITNSFMNETEINANYGKIFATTEKGGKVFVSDMVHIKFIPN